MFSRGLRQVAAELLRIAELERSGPPVPAHAGSHGLAAFLVAALVAAEHLDDRLAHLRRVRPSSEDLGGHALALRQAEQQVLRADVVVLGREPRPARARRPGERGR